MKQLPPSDTRPEAQKILIDAYRRMTPADKMGCVARMKQMAKSLHAAGYRLRHPSASESEIADDWLILTLGEDLAKTVKEARRER